MESEDNLNGSEKTEVYWLLDNVLENLRVIKQVLCEKIEYYDVLFTSSLLAFSEYNLINHITEIEELTEKLKDFRWRDFNWAISFYLGALAENYLIRKINNTLPDTNDIANMFKKIHEKLREFDNDKDPEKLLMQYS